MNQNKQIPDAGNVASAGLGNVIKIDDERVKPTSHCACVPVYTKCCRHRYVISTLSRTCARYPLTLTSLVYHSRSRADGF